jgi:hypothetical protein
MDLVLKLAMVREQILRDKKTADYENLIRRYFFPQLGFFMKG